MWLMLFLLAPLLGSQAVSGQTTIGNVVCSDTNVVEDVPVGADLSDGTTYRTPGTTYRLGAGRYFVNSFTELSDSSPICYIGSGAGATEIQLGDDLQLAQAAQLAFQALTVTGPGGSIFPSDQAKLAADSVVFRDFASFTIAAIDDATVALTNVRVSGSGLGTTAVSLARVGNPTWSNVTFSDNKGAALSLDSSTSLTITGLARFHRNGGSAVATTSSKLTLEDAEFIGNTEGGNGGAMQLGSGTDITVTGSLFVKDNSAGGNGGGVSAGAQGQSGASLTLQGPSVFTGNSAGGNGGAVFLDESSRLTSEGAARFGQNRAGGRGGAIYMTGTDTDDDLKTTVTASGPVCISGNSAGTAGGGVYMEGTSQLLLNSDPSTQLMGGNTPDGIAVRDSAGILCIRVTSTGEGTYFINGPICSCPAPANPGAEVTCAACPGGQVWLVPDCTCGPPCTDPCCEPNGVPSTTDRVCRAAGSQTCTNVTRCDGLLTTCPQATPAAADGTPCGPWHFHQTTWDEERPGYNSPYAAALTRPQGGAAGATSRKGGNPYGHKHSQPHACYGSCKGGVCFFNKPALHKCFG